MQGIHHAAARTRLRAATVLSNKVEDSTRIDTGGKPVAANYVVLKTSLPEFSDPRLAAPQAADHDQTVEFSVRVVAVDLDGLNQLMDAVNDQMCGHRLVVAGRNLTPLERTDLDEPDYDYGARVHFQGALFEATTSRA